MNDEKLFLYCKRSIVEIFFESPETGLCCGGYGVILFYESNFTYIMVYNSCSHGNTGLAIVFGDKIERVVSVPNDRVQRLGDFIGAICILSEDNDASLIKSVEFHEERLLLSESVSTFTFNSEESPTLVPGFVSTSEERLFCHTCIAASKFTIQGAPVFNKYGRLVGLCYNEICGLLAALTVSAITETLSQSYGITNMGIKEILHHIYVSSMAKYEIGDQKDSHQTSHMGDDERNDIGQTSHTGDDKSSGH